MDIALMREFLELVHYSNFTEAARSIPVSQSTLSKHVQHLERELGCVLIERDKQRVSLTPQGRIVAEHAAAIVSNFEARAQTRRRRPHRAAHRGRVPRPRGDAVVLAGQSRP